MTVLKETNWLSHAVKAFTPNKFLADPVGWVDEKLHEFLWVRQREVCESVRDHRYTAVPSCHDAGKSFIASRITSWWLDTHPIGTAFVVTTAPTAAQVEAILWREIGRAHEKGGLFGRITSGNVPMWKTESGQIVAFGRKPADANPTAFQGIHDRYVLVILDEACGIPEALWNAVDALVTNEAGRVLAIGNPDDPTSHFAKICAPGSGWNTIRISAFDTPAFSGERVPPELLELLISKTWVEERRKRWGEGSPLYQAKVLGVFPDVSDNNLILPSWIRAAAEREIKPDRWKAAIGVDVARLGGDETVAYLNQGGHVRIALSARKQRTTKTSGQVLNVHRTHSNRPPVRVDDSGIGGAVTDQLKEAGVPVVAMNGGSSPTEIWPDGKPKFVNARAQWYWNLRNVFDPDQPGEIDIDPADEDLQSQLLTIRYGVDSKGRIYVESKDDMRKRGLPSPDRADALSYTFARVNAMSVEDIEKQLGASDQGGIMNGVMETAW